MKWIFSISMLVASLAFAETVQVPGVTVRAGEVKTQMVAQGALPQGSTGAQVVLPAPASSIKITTSGSCPTVASVTINGKTLVVKGNGSIPLSDNVNDIEISLGQATANQGCQVQVVGTPVDDYSNYDGEGVNINIGGNNYGNITIGQGQQSTTTPTYGYPPLQPVYSQPAYGYAQPVYAQPTYGYAQPVYSVPVTLTPVYAVPTYGYYGYGY